MKAATMPAPMLPDPMTSVGCQAPRCYPAIQPSAVRPTTGALGRSAPSFTLKSRSNPMFSNKGMSSETVSYAPIGVFKLSRS